MEEECYESTFDMERSFSDASSTEEEEWCSINPNALLQDRFLDDEEDIPASLFKVPSAAAKESTNGARAPRHDAQLNLEAADAEELEGELEECFRAAVMAYLQSLGHDAPGYNVLREIQFIADCMGYSLFVRTSMYLGEKQISESCLTGDQRVLQKGILKCERFKDARGKCLFSLTVKTVPLDKAHGRGSSERSYVADLTNCTHSHRSTFGAKVHIPRGRAEVVHVKNLPQMNLKETIRFLEDKYKKPINFSVAPNKKDRECFPNNPTDRECLRLCATLVNLVNEEKENKAFFDIEHSGRMKLACWSYWDWLEEYNRFGVVPGISIDCNALSNRYGSFRLVTITGRANDGYTLTFFVGLISSETEDSFTSVLKYFKSIISLSPCMITMDENMACIKAAEKVFPSSYITLDEWCVNQKQMRNVREWCKKINRLDWCDDMSKDLLNLRRSDAVEKFMKRREELEQKYMFAFNENVPAWYRFLYYERPVMVVSYFKNNAVPRRYLFQGTAFVEASSAGMRAFIEGEKACFWRLPLEIRRFTEQKEEARKASMWRCLANSNAKQRAVRCCGLPLTRKERDRLIREYCMYALFSFVEISLANSKKYHVASYEVLECADDGVQRGEAAETRMTGPIAQFQLQWSHGMAPTRVECSDLQPFSKIVRFGLKRATDGDDGEQELICSCTCNQMQSTGFPCRHVMRIATVYQELSLWKPDLKKVLGDYIPFTKFFDAYWRRDVKCLTGVCITQIRLEAGFYKREGQISKLIRADSEDGRDEGVGAEVRQYLKSGDGDRYVFYKLYEAALKRGAAAVRAVGQLLEAGLECMVRKQSIPASLAGEFLGAGEEEGGRAIRSEGGVASNSNAGNGRMCARKRAHDETR
eukprot:TRINITY_DN114_c0_g1_i1.p1 TRINITY_DN114_c0_g1~~TRINITY_DN114_c0_g1_i1.p1  ORF type:complete len:874 (+),score=123.03 TRINITY_DN114_c0_g1_i1:3646-6267(+)